MNLSLPGSRRAHLLAVSAIVLLEYLQMVMASFASRYISGGIHAAPEDFSLGSALYATVAVVMIFKHRVLVQRFGYRAVLRYALLAFALGALISGLADSLPQYLLGRMVQALGGSAFFTAGRVQVTHHQGAARLTALKCFALGIFIGSSLAPWLAAQLLDSFGWRAIFLMMVPLTALVLLLVEYALPDHEPVIDAQPGRVHAAGTFLLALGVFGLLYVLERLQYDLFSAASLCWLLLGLALLVLGTFLWHDWQRSHGLIPYRSFADGRFLAGLAVYGFGYVVSAACSYLTPVFLGQGLGMPVLSYGWLISLSSAVGIATMLFHLKLMMRHPKARHFLWFAMAVLFIFGWWMSSLSEEVSQLQIFWPLLLSNGLFLVVAQGTAAAGTFRHVDEQVFSQAYQLKNAMREVANAVGVSLATVLIQMRGSLHYQRLAEQTASHSLAELGVSLSQLAEQISRQATLMACQDFYRALCVLAVLAALVVAAQKRFV